MSRKYGTVGVIGRFKPLHNGGAIMLETLCKQSKHVKIGIGSCNKYNIRNPFTAEETEKMIHAFLKPKFKNYSIIYVPDFAHIPEYRDGKKWKEYMIKHYGKLDAFISGNKYVRDLLRDTYKIIAPGTIIPRRKQTKLNATFVRSAIAKEENWQRLVPEEVAGFMQEKKLDERFRREYGLDTLINGKKYDFAETADEEKEHTYEQ